MKGILVKPLEKIEVVEFEANLDEYYRLLDVTCIDIVERKIGGKYYDIICDDEGLLKDDIIKSMISSRSETMLVGNLLICNSDDEGYEQSLSDEDIKNILSKKRTLLDMQKGRKLSIIEGEY